MMFEAQASTTGYLFSFKSVRAARERGPFFCLILALQKKGGITLLVFAAPRQSDVKSSWPCLSPQRLPVEG